MAEPVEPRPAATVVLLRDTPAGMEAWLLRRVPQMAFAAGMTVFPGGRVDPADGDEAVPWVGEDPVEVARRFGCTVPEARASLVAALRETFEETGVLLTQPAPAAADSAELAELRRAVEAHDLAFGAMITARGVAVDARYVRPWSRWVTPEGERRRYDTYFYVAALPDGAVATADTSEADSAQWVPLRAALAEHATGRRPMLPPTVVTLAELAGFGTVAEVLDASAARSLEAVRPLLRRRGDGTAEVVLPDGSTVTL